MFRFPRLILLLLVPAAVVLGGCDGQEEPPAREPAVPIAKRPLRVSVPDEVQGRWKAVKIAVIDKQDNHQEVYAVDIGGSIEIPEAGLTLEVKSFLPAFIMDGTTITSAGNELKNPGAQVVISEDGAIIFQGWLFSLYPGTHAFKHPRYSFTLVDFVPAE